MMTNRERKERQKIRKELIEKGVLPPPKKRVNRKKYAQEVLEWYHNDLTLYDVMKAFTMFIPSTNANRVSDEDMTILRVIHIAKAQKDFSEKLKAEGRSTYEWREWYEEVYCKVYPDSPYVPPKQEQGETE